MALLELDTAQKVRDWGVEVDIRSWRSTNLDSATVLGYDVVTFLWCAEYFYHRGKFLDFVRNVLIPAQEPNPNIHIFNDPAVLLWNADKHYLLELAGAGIRVPKSQIINLSKASRQTLISLIEEFSRSRALVLKPAMGGSSYMTNLVEDSRTFTAKDPNYMDRLLAEVTKGDLIIQEYEDSISSGEYSLVFVISVLTHTILKIPCAGEFKCQEELGGSCQPVSTEGNPQNALDAARKILQYLEAKFEKSEKEAKSPMGRRLVYVRIDGIMKDGSFILMEVEAIEPDLFLEEESGALALEGLREAFTQRIV